MAKPCGAVAPVACLLLAFVALQVVLLLLEVDLREVFQATGLDLKWTFPGPAGKGFNCSTGGGEENANSTSLAFRPAGVGLYPVVLFSAFRESGSRLHVVTLVSRLIHEYGKPVFDCSWHPGNGSTPLVTAAKLKDGSSTFAHLPYNEVLFTCQFEQEVGADGQGGSLYLDVVLSARAKEVGQVPPILALRESAGYNFTESVARPRPYRYAFCSSPISGHIRAEVIKEWMIYHLYIYGGPKAHFFLYNIGGVTEEVRAVLDPFVKDGFVTIFDVLNAVNYPAWYSSQILFMNDCLHRLRYLTDWIFFHDFDEFLYVAPPDTLSSLMEAHAEAPAVTYGSWPISVKVCRPQEKDGEWLLEPMLWREPSPECRDPKQPNPFLCLGSVARRKYAVNPRKEIMVGIHSPLGSSYKQAFHMDASVMRLEHFRGILNTNLRICLTHRNRSSPVNGKIEMESVIVPFIPKATEYATASLNLTL